MTPRRVAVLSGGRSSEHEVSLRSGAAVADGLERAGHQVERVEVRRDGTWGHDGEEVALRAGRGLLDVDAVFPVLHGPFGEDGTVQGLLECLDVPYVGAGVAAASLCMDKVLFKELMARRGLPQVDYEGVADAAWSADRPAVLRALERLGLPVFVKPARLGSSVGIVKAGSPEEVARALDGAFAHDPLAIVEGFSPGMEVECSVLGNESPEASKPGEVVFQGEFYDYDAKYRAGGMDLVVPARIPAHVADRVRALAVEAFRLAGCAGLARVDFFVEGEEVLVNELNTMPGFTETSVYGKLFAASGVPYEELLSRLVELALERHERERRYRF